MSLFFGRTYFGLFDLVLRWLSFFLDFDPDNDILAKSEVKSASLTANASADSGQSKFNPIICL